MPDRFASVEIRPDGVGRFRILQAERLDHPQPGQFRQVFRGLVAVELDEQPGLRFTATVAGADNDNVRIGRRARLDWIERDDVPVPVWRLEEGA